MHTRSATRKRASEDAMESMMDAEKFFFVQRVTEGLERARGVLSSFGQMLPDAVVTDSMKSLCHSLGQGSAWQVFQSMFRKEEWDDLCGSDAAIHAKGERAVYALRQRRQKRLFEEVSQVIMDDGQRGDLDKLLRKWFHGEEEDMSVEEKHGLVVQKKSFKKKKKKKQVEKTSDEEDGAFVSSSTAGGEDEVVALAPPPPAEVPRLSSVEEPEAEDDHFDVWNRMQQSVAVVAEILQQQQHVGITGPLVPPDPRQAEASRGEALILHSGAAAHHLLDDSSLSLSVSEQVGRLVSWWQLCRRSFAVAGVLAYLRTTSGGGGTLRERFRAAVGPTIRLTYEQATRYDKLAKVLLEYPLLMYQLERVTLTAWTEQRSSDDIPDYWRQQKVPLEEQGGGMTHRCCCKCGMSERVSQLWSCDACNHFFHDTCAGYEHQSLTSEPELGHFGNVQKISLYCDNCLSRKKLRHVDVALRVSEVRAVAAFLNKSDCPFWLQQVDGDGYCIFGILESFARESFSYSDTSDAFCGLMADAALTSIEQTRVEHGQDAVEDVCEDAFFKLQRNGRRKKRLQDGLWRQIEVEHLFLGFVRCFPLARVWVYRTCNHVLERSGTVYGQQQGEKDLFLLEWKTTQHYDRLRTE